MLRRNERFNIHKNPVSVPNVGKVTLTELLDNKDYNKIYIMLGINELGYNFENILSKYEELVNFVKEKEPATSIIIQGNLHVTPSRSDSDDTFNNNTINNLNAALSNFADNEHIFYFDVNSLFDDENGALSADKSEDDTHLYAKYYAEWGQWIVEQTSLIMGGDLLNNKDEFCENIRQYEKAMYHLAFSLLRNDADAGDVISESIYRAYKNLDTLKHKSSFKAWILQIVHNTAVETIRKNSKVIPVEELKIQSFIIRSAI